MAIQTAHTATCMCTFGAAPGMIQVTSEQTVQTCSLLAATINDITFTPFGMCSCPANPAVASATAAALGVLTPQPCIPVVPMPWTTGSPTVLIMNQVALNHTSTAMCAYGGVITVKMPMAPTVMIP